VSKQDTEEYCRQFKLEPRNDSSNNSTEFLRNRIRLELLPALKKYNPQLDAALLRLAVIAADEVSISKSRRLVGGRKWLSLKVK